MLSMMTSKRNSRVKSRSNSGDKNWQNRIEKSPSYRATGVSNTADNIRVRSQSPDKLINAPLFNVTVPNSYCNDLLVIKDITAAKLHGKR